MVKEKTIIQYQLVCDRCGFTPQVKSEDKANLIATARGCDWVILDDEHNTAYCPKCAQKVEDESD